MQGQGDLFEHPFGELHHPEVVLVGYVNLHNGKFGVVRAVHAFVAEVLAEFIHAVEASYDPVSYTHLCSNAVWTMWYIVWASLRRAPLPASWCRTATSA